MLNKFRTNLRLQFKTYRNIGIVLLVLSVLTDGISRFVATGSPVGTPWYLISTGFLVLAGIAAMLMLSAERKLVHKQ